MEIISTAFKVPRILGAVYKETGTGTSYLFYNIVGRKRNDPFDGNLLEATFLLQQLESRFFLLVLPWLTSNLRPRVLKESLASCL